MFCWNRNLSQNPLFDYGAESHGRGRTFAGEVHGLLRDPVAGARDRHLAAEDRLLPQSVLVKDLVDGDVEEPAPLHRQRRGHAAFRRPKKSFIIKSYLNLIGKFQTKF